MNCRLVAGVFAVLAASLSFGNEDCLHARSAARFVEAGCSPASMMGLDAPTDTDVLSYDLDIEAKPSTSEIIGSNLMTIRVLSPTLTDFRFRLRENYTITRLELDGRPISFVRESITTVRAVFDQNYFSGQTFTLRVDYGGVAVSAGFGSIVFGTRSNGQPYVFTLSEPYYAYTWWPGKDNNTDKAIVRIAVTVPNTMTVCSNGLLTSTQNLSGNRKKFTWESQYPIADYLVCFGATNFTRFTDSFVHSGGSMLLDFYIWPESNTTSNRNGWLASKNMLTTFGNLYGTYPFISEKYGIYQFTFSGGMEHQTMTGQSGFTESVTSHELAHQWWGDCVTCGTWSDIWLNEGFATYSEALWLEFKPGSTGLEALKTAMSNRRPSSMNGTVYRFDTTNINSIFSSNFAYRKGAWVLHMLRHIVGDETFFAALAEYRKRFQYNSAITDDLQQVFEDVAGYDLSWFFDPWIYQPGAPAYNWGWQTTQVAGSSYLLLYLTQTQSSSYPRYTLPIDIRPTVGGQKQFLKVFNNSPTQHFVLPIPAAATACSFDEDVWILRTTTTNVSYVPGPPKIVIAVPNLGSTVTWNGASQIRITFHTPVNANAGHFSVVGNSSGNRGFSYSYDSSTNTAILTLNEKSPLGWYTVNVSDNITAVNSGQKLDGEIANPINPTSLPSGNGVQGGSSQIRFRVAMLPWPPG